LNAPGADVYQGLLGALLCSAIGSIFAATDAALSSLSHAHLLALQDQAHGRSKAALDRYLAKPTAQHSQWLVGRVVFTALAAVLVANVMVPYVPGWALAPLGALGALLTFGTLAQVGTTIGRARPDYFATRALANVRPLELFVWPLAAPLSKLGHLATGMLGPARPRDATVTKTEVELVVDESEKEGSLGEEPAGMIRNVLGLKDLVVRDVMVPRTRVCAIEAETPLIEVLRFAAVEGHSRYPVYREKIDNVVGVLYVKDLFRIVNDNQLHSTRLRDLVRANVSFVPEMQTVSSVLADMRSHRLHLAIVIDEFGGVSGIVTLEDILEVIVGDIRDEYDTEDAPIQDLGDGLLVADAAVSIHDLSTYLGAEIPEDGDYESLGGLLVHRAGTVPPVGATLAAFGLTFVVREADEKRISKVEIRRPVSESMAPAPPRDSGDQAPRSSRTSVDPKAGAPNGKKPPAAAS
jgi:CBS domain containing-hemolysin-like protein